MSYFDNESNVEQYIKMAEEFNGQEIINHLYNYLPLGSSVLELGMGPGTDIPLLEKHCKVTGSDYSKIFIPGGSGRCRWIIRDFIINTIDQ